MPFKIDLHIHSRDCSDGRMNLDEIFQEAAKRKVDVLSVTDHDSIDCQEPAEILAQEYGIRYIRGLELNVSYSHPPYKDSKPISLDFLGYQYDIHNGPLVNKLTELREYREKRAKQILEKINLELSNENREIFTEKDMEAIQKSVEGAFGRPHIANYMVEKGIVSDKQEAFNKYLTKCNVPKMPLSLAEASSLVRGAGGKLMIAHPNDPNGTSLVSFTSSLDAQLKIIEEGILPYIDGIECWHTRHDQNTVQTYLRFAKEKGLMVTGGSDCHQQPVIMGTVPIPVYVAEQFGIRHHDFETGRKER
jgi:predicted metal-dependent phosphoesterase TrpH